MAPTKSGALQPRKPLGMFDTDGNSIQIGELIKNVEDRGFVNRGGKGSNRNFLHPSGVIITISGNLGDDAKQYQEREVKKVIKEAQENETKR